MSLLIERARMQNLDALVKLESEVFNASDWPLSRRAFRYHLQSDNLLLLARQSESDLSPVAYILALKRKRSARIYSLAVSAVFRGQGVASALIQKALKDCMESKLHKVRLEVRINNSRAIRLYQALGFETVDIYPDYYQDHGDACRMEWRYHKNSSGHLD